MELNELELLWNAADIEEKENRKLVQDFIQGMTNEKVDVRVSFCTREISMSVDFVDENNKDVFGASFDLYYKAKYDYKNDCYGPMTLYMSHGTIGSYSRSEEPYQISRLKLMTAIWENENKLTSFLDSLVFEKTNAAHKAQREYDREQRELKEKAEEEKRNNIISNLVAGYKFEETLKNETKVEYEITKITPKRVYINFTTISPHWNYKYDENYNCIGKTYGNTINNCDGYIKYDDLLYSLIHKLENYHNIMARNNISMNWIEERFEPISS